MLLGFFGEGVFGKVMKVEVFGLFNMFYRFEVVVKMLKGGVDFFVYLNYIFFKV